MTTPEIMRSKFDHALAAYTSANHPEVLTRCDDILALVPDHPSALHMKAVAYFQTGRLREAETTMKGILAVHPGMVDVRNNLSMVLQTQGRVDEAIGYLVTGIQLNPDFPVAHSNLIYSLDHHPDTNDATCFRERRIWNERYAKRFTLRAAPLDNDRTPDRKLRIGYVSADFRNHSASFLFTPVIATHDRTRYEAHCFSSTKIHDPMTDHIRRHVEFWHECSHLDDDQFWRLVREKQIDILVDLSGHSEGNRLLAFARRAAPVQVTAWGYANGTGLDAMDYIITDRTSIPPEAERYFQEKPALLPVMGIFGPPINAPDVNKLPALEKGIFTFGSLNRSSKLTESTIALWARVLKAVPSSRFYLKDRGMDSEAGLMRVKNLFTKYGIDLARIQFVGGSVRMEHLRAYNWVDLALDPIPAGGGVTLCEGMWMGVPSVLLLGKQLSGRGPSGIAAAVGLREAFVAVTEDEYVEKAVNAAGRLDELAALRAQLRERMAASPLCQHAVYTRMVELAYRVMWQRWCGGAPASMFSVVP